MKNLVKINQNAFKLTPIVEFDAPNLQEIEVDWEDNSFSNQNEEEEENEEEHEESSDSDEELSDSKMLQVAEHNFQVQHKCIKQIPKCPHQEPPYIQLMEKLPKRCFECSYVDERNAIDFLIDNCLVFPENVKVIAEEAYSGFRLGTFYIFGLSVEAIQDRAFKSNRSVRKAVFPNLIRLGNSAFIDCKLMHTFTAPKCSLVGDTAFSGCAHLKALQISPKTLPEFVFDVLNIPFLDLPSVESVDAYAFRGSKVSKVRLANCKSVHQHAFCNVFQEIQVQTAADLNGAENCAKVDLVVDQKMQLKQLQAVVGIIAEGAAQKIVRKTRQQNDM